MEKWIIKKCEGGYAVLFYCRGDNKWHEISRRYVIRSLAILDAINARRMIRSAGFDVKIANIY